MRVVQIVVDVASHTGSPCRPWGSSQLGENAVPSAAVDSPSTNLVVVVDGTHSGLIVRGRPLVDEVSGMITISLNQTPLALAQSRITFYSVRFFLQTHNQGMPQLFLRPLCLQTLASVLVSLKV